MTNLATTTAAGTLAGRSARSTRIPSRVLIGILCLVFVGMGFALLQSVEAERAARQQIVQTSDVLRHLRTSLRAGLDAETGQRGFLLTGDRLYLRPYDRGEREWLVSIDALDRSLAERATGGRAEAIARMRSLAAEKLDELSRTIELARAGDIESALDLVESDEGRRLMDRFRAEVMAMEDEEQELLSAALLQAEVVEARLLPILLMLTVTAIGLLVLGFWLERRAAMAEARAQEADELRLARERSDLLARELNHRVKNLFSVILAIISMAGRGASAEVRNAILDLRERIHALSLAHAVSQGQLHQEIIALKDFLSSTLEPYRGENPADSRVSMEGPSVDIPAKSVTPMGLVVHELATNAVKYGALSVPDGRVVIEWEVLARDPELEGGPILAMTWSERGGPPAQQPKREGFGSTMLRLAAHQLQGTFDRRWTADGLVAELRLPLPETMIAGTSRSKADTAEGGTNA